MKNHKGTLLLTCLVISLVSCRNFGTTAAGDGVDSDSIAPHPLTSKQLQSIDDIDYKVTVYDTLHTGEIDCLRDMYDGHNGSFTFRGGLKRDANYGGKIKGRPHRVVKDWIFKTLYDTTETALGSWGGGSGWTGQPVYVRWNKKGMPQEEIILGSLCGRVYFLDYRTGQPTRHSIDVTNPIKGSVSLDPTLNGNLYVGQGIPKVAPMNQLCISIPRHTITYRSGADSEAWLGWGASDSSPVRIGQFLFWPSENGTIYKYLIVGDSLVRHSALRLKPKRGVPGGVENSMCVYRNHGFFATNAGDVYCIDLNTLKPLWHYDSHDDIDASIVCEVEGDVPYLYVGSEVDRQGDSGLSYFTKLNGNTGQPVWQRSFPCNKLLAWGKHYDGGLYGTPLLGRGNCKDLIFFNLCQYETSDQADLLALNRKTGKTVYRKRLNRFAWSSMVGFLNEKGEQYLFAGDSEGNAYLIEGRTGRILFCQHMVNNFESSPVVIGNTLVVGSRGQEIYRFHIE